MARPPPDGSAPGPSPQASAASHPGPGRPPAAAPPPRPGLPASGRAAGPVSDPDIGTGADAPGQGRTGHAGSGPARSGSGLAFGFARDHQVALDGDRLILGPGASLAGLREARRRAGRGVRLERCSEAGFQAALAALYQDPVPGAGPAAAGADDGDDTLHFAEADRPGPVRDLLEDARDAPVIQLVNRMLRQALRQAASDVHVEPHEAGLRVRLRVDGTLHTAFDRPDVPARRVISRLKVMAGLDIAETRLPQDGRIALRLGGRAIDVRMSTLPGHHGERVVLRLLDRSAGLMPLDGLGLEPAQAAALAGLAARPDGIILATGPTGSGKTTTLYSLLALAGRDDRNIVTVEDPVEYDLPGISQCQINSEIGMTFAAGLRAVLRQDPDVILVGEIRDRETAQVAAEAALTGHLVLSSVHANSPLATIVRLRELGVADYLISATLRGVLAQRLLRRLCPDCRRPAPPTPDEAAALRAAGCAVPALVYQAVGCAACAGSGHAGRVGVFDILAVDDRLRAAIEAGAAELGLRAAVAAPEAGLRRAALARVAAGEVAMAELRRVIGDPAGPEAPPLTGASTLPAPSRAPSSTMSPPARAMPDTPATTPAPAPPVPALLPRQPAGQGPTPPGDPFADTSADQPPGGDRPLPPPPRRPEEGGA